MDQDREDLVARAGAARRESARLERLASEIEAEVSATCARHQMLTLSPTVEARLHIDRGDAQRSPLTSVRDIRPETRDLYEKLTDWHSTESRSPS